MYIYIRYAPIQNGTFENVVHLTFAIRTSCQKEKILAQRKEMEEIVNIPVEQQLYQHFRCVLGHSKRTSNDLQMIVFHENIKFIYS